MIKVVLILISWSRKNPADLAYRYTCIYMYAFPFFPHEIMNLGDLNCASYQ